jgi:hypothetical protein
MVLGMHRSGTSLCSHVLSALGLDMTDNKAAPGHDGPNEDNPLGHWERWEIVEFHDRILQFFNRGFFTPYHDFSLPVAWPADPRVAGVRRELTAFLEERMGNGYFGFKDPRTVRLMPMWHQVISELNLAPKIIFCLRNPAQVARSLNVRDGFSRDICEYRWFSYAVDFFQYAKESEFCTIEYESWFEDPHANLAKLRDFLGLSEDGIAFYVDQEISEIVRHELRHDDKRLSGARPLIRSVYELARRADHETAAREQAETIAAQFVMFQQSQGALQRNFEDHATAAARLPALEDEVAMLREELVGAERRAQGAQAIPEIQGELTRLSEALARAEREVWDRAGLVETMRAELLSLSETLALTRHEARERVAIMASMEAELAGMREAVAKSERAEQEADARAAEVARLGSEVAGLRPMVTRAQQDAEQNAATSKSLRSELAAAESALIAAREVGRAAINGRATANPAPFDRLPQLGWRQRP